MSYAKPPKDDFDEIERSIKILTIIMLIVFCVGYFLIDR